MTILMLTAYRNWSVAIDKCNAYQALRNAWTQMFVLCLMAPFLVLHCVALTVRAPFFGLDTCWLKAHGLGHYAAFTSEMHFKYAAAYSPKESFYGALQHLGSTFTVAGICYAFGVTYDSVMVSKSALALGSLLEDHKQNSAVQSNPEMRVLVNSMEVHNEVFTDVPYTSRDTKTAALIEMSSCQTRLEQLSRENNVLIKTRTRAGLSSNPLWIYSNMNK